jgi:hypothetical protein
MDKNKDLFGRRIPNIAGSIVYVNTIHKNEKNPIYYGSLELKKESGNYESIVIPKKSNILYSNKKEDFLKLVKEKIDLLGLKNKNHKDINNFSLSGFDCIWDADEKVVYFKKNNNQNKITITIK